MHHYDAYVRRLSYAQVIQRETFVSLLYGGIVNVLLDLRNKYTTCSVLFSIFVISYFKLDK